MPQVLAASSRPAHSAPRRRRSWSAAERHASRSFTRAPVRSTAPAYSRPTAAPARRPADEQRDRERDLAGVAEPSAIRTGIASADENGRIEATTDSVESGSCSAPIEMKNDTKIIRLIGTIAFCSSSMRETSEPATANSPA